MTAMTCKWFDKSNQIQILYSECESDSVMPFSAGHGLPTAKVGRFS